MTIAILGEFDRTFKPHIATNEALRHSADLDVSIAWAWVATNDIDDSLFARFGAVWVAPGSPYKNLERTLWAIRHAREYGIPCFGTCGGFQHMVLEYARNVLGVEAAHAEYYPHASDLFVSRLECSLAGREMTLNLVAGSRVAEIYGALKATEEYYCNFGVNPDKVLILKSRDLRITGSDAEGEVRVIELPRHPFFLGTLFVPQAKSRPGRPHPLVNAFVSAAASRALLPDAVDPISIGNQT